MVAWFISNMKPSSESYFFIMKELSRKHLFDINNINITECLAAINNITTKKMIKI